jgi:hypothetical protein
LGLSLERDEEKISELCMLFEALLLLLSFEGIVPIASIPEAHAWLVADFLQYTLSAMQ